MKIRIKGNSVRLRLMQSEVAELEEKGKVSERIQFTFTHHLTYTVAQADIENITAQYLNNEIKVLIPIEQAKDWASSNIVSLEHLAKIGEEETLRILIEKDFKCLSVRVHEDESDAYPHPKEGTLVC